MSDRPSYQALAQECLTSAETFTDAGERLQLLELARGYMKLAAYVGNRSNDTTAHRPSGFDPDNHPSDS